MKTKILLLAFFSLAISAYSQNTYVPDDNFENYLETHNASGNVVSVGDPTSLGNGIANDDYVTTAKINTIGYLDVSNQGISDLTGIEGFTALQSLYCGYNQLTDLNVTQNSALSVLKCYHNQLTSLNVSFNYYLETLECNDNEIVTLDFSQNHPLSFVSCYNNQIIGLDFSQNIALYTLLAYNNQLYSLIMKNVNNVAISNFNVLNNPYLTCIEVDDEDWSTANWLNVDATAVYSEDCAHVGLTYVPDDNFENYLETHDAAGTIVSVGDSNSMGNGVAGDDYVTTASIDSVINLNVTSQAILDLTGIEDFEALENLHSVNNQLTSIDLTQNILLKKLYLNNNQLANLDVSQNILLEYLDISSNEISTIDVTQNIDLDHFYITNNPIATIDVSQSIALEYFHCNSTELTSLDLTQNIVLFRLHCQNNSLTSLNVKNGNNSNLNGQFFNSSNNPYLTCIEVDDAVYSATNWTNKDNASTFVNNQTECAALSTSEFTQIDFNVYPNPVKHKLTVSITNEASYSLITVSGQVVKSGQLRTGENTLNVSSFSSGLYFLHVKTESGISTKKIIKD